MYQLFFYLAAEIQLGVTLNRSGMILKPLRVMVH